MDRKTYYYILLFGLSAFVVLDVIKLISSITSDYSLPIKTQLYKNLFACIIVGFETYQSKKIIKYINLGLIPFIIIGFLFFFMHWPYSLELILCSFFIMILSLTISGLKNNENRTEKLVILIYPLIHLSFIYLSIHWYSFSSIIPVIELGLMLSIVIYIKTLLSRINKNE
jgi:hypothetical protein